MTATGLGTHSHLVRKRTLNHIAKLAKNKYIGISILTEENFQSCEGPVTDSELLNALKSMLNDKSPGNDGLTKELYEAFWEEIKIPLFNSIMKSFQNGELSTSPKKSCNKT